MIKPKTKELYIKISHKALKEVKAKCNKEILQYEKSKRLIQTLQGYLVRTDGCFINITARY
jgi:hypothetical protein